MAQQTINHGTVAGDGTGESPFTGMQKINANFTELYSRMGTAESNINLKAPINNPTFTGTVNGITKAMVGLSNVDNVADANKPVSSAQAAAIAAGDNLRLKVNDVYDDFVITGLTTPVPVNSLDGTLSVGSAYVDGIRTTLGSASTYTYLALRDTYVDIDSAGAIYRSPVVNGNAEPSLTAGRLRLEKVVTDGSKITTVTAVAPRIVKGHPATFATDASGNTVLVGAGGAAPIVAGLTPTGNDQTAEIQQYLNDTVGGNVFAEFGVGEFIISGDLIVHARRNSPTEITAGSAYGYGLNIRGCGPNNTILKDVRANKATPLMLITDPDGTTNGKRNKMAHIGEFSLYACNTSGVILTGQANLSGMGIASYASVGTGYGAHVLHTSVLERILMSGYQYPMTFDDCTQIEISRCAFVEFATAIRAGGNADLWDIHHCAFGSELFGTPRNDAVAFDNTYSGPIGITGAGNNMKFRHCWVMQIGDFYVTNQTTFAPSAIEFEDVYYEKTRRYFFAKDNSDVSPGYKVIFDKCHFSQMGTNDFASAVKGNADFGAKIQFGASNINTAVSGGPVPILTIKDCSGDITPNNALVVFNNRQGEIRWERNEIPEHATYKHVRCIRDGWENWRSMKSTGYSDTSVHATLRNSQAAGLGLENASALRVTATIAAAGTYNLNQINGNLFELTLPDGNCTIDYAAYAAGPPSPLLASGTEIDVILIAPASVTATRTITWGARMSMDAATLTYSGTEQGKRAMIKLRAPKDSGNVMRIVSRDPVFI